MLAEREARWRERDPHYGRGIPAPDRVINPLGLAKQLVVAAYREDLSWLRDVRIPVLIYSKDPGNRPGLSNVLYVDQQNVGREASAYLAHIVANYDRLADVSFFVQGDALRHSPDLLDRLEHPYQEPTSLTAEYAPHFPPREIKDQDRVYTIHGHVVRLGDARWFGGREPEKNKDWLAGVWAHWFSCPPPDVWRYGYASMHAVPRASIQGRPREFWEWALGQATNPANAEEMTVASAWALEAVWLYLFGDPAQWPIKWPREPLEGEDTPEAGESPLRDQRPSREELRRRGMTGAVRRGGCNCGGRR
jgi:hypothetical protein